ncbi:Vacuolar protein sorting-associated protein 13-like, N-terminal domain [Dillenia turbinata]|uniref:Vacuolar protein sorting-associated protein 13-like, N-terminal domain n=1 Tax=Dillenia turbinata TaxID=194707 RepID=A0AAN8VJY5_9MAGN
MSSSSSSSSSSRNKYLGNYVRGLNKEALKISVWQGDVELTNMQLKPEALNALKLPVKVKAGFLGSVKLKIVIRDLLIDWDERKEIAKIR